MTNPTQTVPQRGFENLTSLLEDEHDSLQSMIQRRLNKTIKKRRSDRAAKYSARLSPSVREKVLDPHELLDLLGKLNRPQAGMAVPAMS